MGDYSRRMMPVVERVERSESRVPRRLAISAIVVQVWLLSAYLLVDVLPYFWPDAVLAGWMDDAIGAWLMAVPALLLGFVAFWVAVFDTYAGAALAVTGVAVLLSARRRLSRRVRGLLFAGTVLSLALLVFSLTPLAEDIRIWVLD
jgi:hypothetical protein